MMTEIHVNFSPGVPEKEHRVAGTMRYAIIATAWDSSGQRDHLEISVLANKEGVQLPAELGARGGDQAMRDAMLAKIKTVVQQAHEAQAKS